MAKKVTTLFIRDNGICIAVFNGQKIDKWAAAPLEPGLVVQGFITDLPKVAAAVRDCMKSAGIRGGKTVVGVSGVNSLYRLITLPEMPENLLAEAIRREAKRVLPVSLDEVYLSYQEVPAISKGEKRLFLATYPKNTTEAVVKTARLAGLDPYLMDLAPLALARIPDEPRAIIVHARGTHADILIIEDRMPQLIRVLALSADTASLAEKLPGISEELSRTVIFYNSSHAERPLNPSVPLFVSGELASSPESWPQLVGRLNFPVSLLTTGFVIPDGMPENDFMINVGLALKEIAAENARPNASFINFNILPEVYRPRRVNLSYVIWPVLGIIVIASLIYGATFVSRAAKDTEVLRQQAAQGAPCIAEQRQKLAALKSDVEKLRPKVAPLDAEKAQYDAITGIFTSTLSGLNANRDKVDSDMSQRVVGMLPFNKSDLGLLSVTHDGSEISITGNAAHESHIFSYGRKLRESGGINAVIVQSIQAIEGGYTYKLLLR